MIDNAHVRQPVGCARPPGDPHSRAVRDTVARWAGDPTEGNREAVRRTTRRLYDAQHRHGDWCAHRGIIAGSRITSPSPRNARAALDAPTWDNATRNSFYNKLQAIRGDCDNARADEASAFLADDGDNVRHHRREADTLFAELDRSRQSDWPGLGQQHMGLSTAMLAAYRASRESPSPSELPGDSTKG